MKSKLLLMTVVAGCAAAVHAQAPTRNPRPTPVPIVTQQTQGDIDRANDLNRRSNDLRLTENLPAGVKKENKAFREAITPLYRETTKEEREFMAPDPALAEKYSDFLGQKNTGLIRLVPDRGCSGNENVVKTTPQCEGLTMPGAGSGWSFRTRDYRILDLSDLNLRKNLFESLGVLNHGLMVNLGDVPIGEVDLDSEGMKYLAEFKPADDFRSAAEIAQKLTGGIVEDGYRYASIALVDENKTYGLRVIAYRGVSPKTAAGITFNEFELDKREDIIVVFRVVRLDANGDATILWKELKSRKSPKLTPDK